MEITLEELEEKLSAILYRRRSNSNRVKIFNLPISRSLDRSKRALKKFISEYFGVNFKSFAAFDHFIKYGLLELNYVYVAFVFDHDSMVWPSSF